MRGRSDITVGFHLISAAIVLLAIVIGAIKSALGGEWSDPDRPRIFGNPNANNYMSVRCPTCGATDYCRTRSGAEAFKPHVARVRAFEQRKERERGGN